MLTNLAVLIACVVIATGAFVWLAGGILSALNWPIARLGSDVHKMLGTLPHNESEAWLFVLLLGVTRILVLLVGTVVFAASLAILLLPVPEVLSQIRDALLNAFFILLAMRLISIFLGALVIGGSVRNVLKTLRG